MLEQFQSISNLKQGNSYDFGNATFKILGMGKKYCNIVNFYIVSVRF